jgi:hypothetical protein
LVRADRSGKFRRGRVLAAADTVEVESRRDILARARFWRAGTRRKEGSIMQVLSPGARTFLFSFLPMCLALGASFLMIGAAIRGKIKENLASSLHRTEAVLDQVNALHKRRTTRLISVLSEQAELKAVLGLLREAPRDREVRRQIRNTLEDQLHDLGILLDYDLLVVADVNGAPIAAIAGPQKKSVPPDFIQAAEGQSPSAP